ncbi:hypothetical protein CKO31_16890 [Thiohalocapsa halophila]|uniref:VWFA domain-containing protein n=1 Tax=Thiohalocapsa halophila TaxID=69359 RepID=A0ABS1CL19_9GAMM|nr:VWA domain-containing protein [Thiohalocapsa halophila]MBK1632383.1 hypothetical protein [Thiohalocapsa halophila]
MSKHSKTPGRALRALALLATLAFSPLAWAVTDLVFVVDGSGSISSTDWNIQKDGIVAALQDPLTVPVDGSIGVAVVQFSGSARVEFPYRIIDSAADVSAAVAAVTGMSQIRGSTGPGEGIQAATGHMLPNARMTADQSFCLSTDGTTNTGTSVGTAISQAKSAGFGLDKFSVIAIEDLPFFDAQRAESHYGPHVFGGGTVFVVKNAVEFANTIGTLCLGEPVKLVGLEVTQAVQDLENSVALVENKDTLVRAYLEPQNGTDPVKATARLRGYNALGTELSGSPLTAVNAGAAITAKPDALDRRPTKDDSLNFRLPTSWTTGTVTLELEGVGNTLTCEEAAGPTANDCMAQVAFNTGSEVELKFFKVQWEDNGGTTHVPSSADLNNLEQRALAMLPTAQVDRTTGSTIDMGTGFPALADVNAELEWKRFLDLCWSVLGCERRYYGALRNPGSLSGLANDIPGTVSSSIIKDGDVVGRNVHIHEIGHTMGRHHAVSATAVGTDGAGRPLGPCRSVAGTTAPDFPFVENVSGSLRSVLGPLTLGDEKIMFGWDSLRDMVLDPTAHYELMSYCGNSNNTSQWISSFTWEGLRNTINSEFDNLPPAGAGTGTSYMMMRGRMNFSTGTAEFRPVLGFEVGSGITPPTPPAGDYDLVLLDGSGAEISSIAFTPVRMDPFLSNPSARGDELGLFLIPVLDDGSVRGARVESAGMTLTSVTASDNPPTVQLLSPNGGEVWSGTNETVSWSQNDADGDDLIAAVQFSPDNGATWQTIGMDVQATSVDVNPQELAETNQALIRVQVSDGFDTAEDVSDATFTTPNSAPTCDITQPGSGDLFVSVQPVNFVAFTNDVEDGTVAGSNISWSSDLDGNLGAGSSITPTADELTEGTHTITMICTDSGGATDEDSVQIDVARVAGPTFTPGDADGDGDIDRDDVLAIIRNLRQNPATSCPACDMDGDGDIDGLDFREALLSCTRPRCAP